MDYVKASKLATRNSETITTGSPELDKLLGDGIKPPLFYHFYGERTLIEQLFRHLTVNALKPRKTVAYMIINNYRKQRINLDLTRLAELAEDTGHNIWEAMNQVRIFTASTADQQTQLTEELHKFIKQQQVNLVLVDGIYKLHRDDPRKKHRHKAQGQVQHSINALRQQCMQQNIPLVSSGRPTKHKNTLIPRPESSSYLRHTANIITYLRPRRKNSQYNRAYLIDHPHKQPTSIEYRYRAETNMGRETKPFRQQFQETVKRLTRELQTPLVDQERKKAFNQLHQAWASEQGAMSYAESYKLIDLLLMVALLDNRAKINELTQLLKKHMETG
jgi:hypothetical protein